MGFKDLMAKAAQKMSVIGHACGSEFPINTEINFKTIEGEQYLLFTYPNKTEEKITHDMIKCATVLAMGVIEIKDNGKVTTSIYGTKYLCVFKDGREAVLTVGLGNAQNYVERVLF